MGEHKQFVGVAGVIRIKCGIYRDVVMDVFMDMDVMLLLLLLLGWWCIVDPTANVGGANDVPLMAIPRQIKRKCDVDGNKYKVNRFVDVRVQSLQKNFERRKKLGGRECKITRLLIDNREYWAW